jgi:hypothetical protein
MTHLRRKILLQVDFHHNEHYIIKLKQWNFFWSLKFDHVDVYFMKTSNLENILMKQDSK